METTGAVPVPARVIVCVGPRLKELSLTVSDPVAGPVTEGVNVTDTVQVDPPARGGWQLFVSPNPPLAEMLRLVSGLPPKLVIVMDWLELVVPTFYVKFKVSGEKLIADGGGLGTGKGWGVAPKT